MSNEKKLFFVIRDHHAFLNTKKNIHSKNVKKKTRMGEKEREI